MSEPSPDPNLPDPHLRQSARRILRARRGRVSEARVERSPRRRLEFALAVALVVALILLVLGLQTGLIG
jgi:type VI protein secretion system component VasK